jgi:hypothetical protein
MNYFRLSGSRRSVRPGYGEEVALAVGLCSVGIVLWRVVAGLVLSDRVTSGSVTSLDLVRSVLSMVVEGAECSAGSGADVLEK